MSKARLSSKGQITLPADVRGALRVGAGDTLIFEKTADDDAFLVRAASADVRRLKGIVPAPATPVTLEAMEAAIRNSASRKR
jgi:antitoxin PrlF